MFGRCVSHWRYCSCDSDDDSDSDGDGDDSGGDDSGDDYSLVIMIRYVKYVK